MESHRPMKNSQDREKQQIAQVLATLKPEGTIATDPELEQVHQQLDDSVHNRCWRFYFINPRTRQQESHLTRPRLRNRDPWYLRPSNIWRARNKDVVMFTQAAQALGVNGTRQRMIVISQQTSSPITAREFSRWLNRLSHGQVAAEITFTEQPQKQNGSISASTGPSSQRGTTCLMAIIALGPQVELTNEQILKKLPNAQIQRFKGPGAALYEYLQQWAIRRFWQTSPERQAQRIIEEKGRQLFHSIGKFAELKAWENQQTLLKRRSNPKIQLVHGREDRLNDDPQYVDARLDRCRETLPTKWLSATGSPLGPKIMEEIMLELELRMKPTSLTIKGALDAAENRLQRHLTGIRRKLTVLNRNLAQQDRQSTLEMERREHEELARGSKRVQ